MTDKTDATIARLNESFKKTQPLPQWTGVPALGHYAAPMRRAATALRPRAEWLETPATTTDAAAGGAGPALWTALDTARGAAKEGLVLGVLALAATVSVVQAFGNVDELALGLLRAGAWATRLVG